MRRIERAMFPCSWPGSPSFLPDVGAVGKQKRENVPGRRDGALTLRAPEFSMIRLRLVALAARVQLLAHADAVRVADVLAVERDVLKAAVAKELEGFGLAGAGFQKQVGRAAFARQRFEGQDDAPGQTEAAKLGDDEQAL